MEAKRALITGITGQDGSYLAELLLEKGYTVFGMVRRASKDNFERIEHILAAARAQAGRSPGPALADPDARGEPAAGGLQPRRAVVRAHVVDPARADRGVHRARRDALARRRPPRRPGRSASTRPSSSEMFGKVRETPQTERTPFHPRSPYGVAKVYGHYITVNYRESYGLFACSGILFNHESPRRGLEFVTRKVTDAAARIKHGLAAGAAPGQPRRAARLGLRRRLRAGHVAHAPAGGAGRLRGRDGRDATPSRSWSSTPSTTPGSTGSEYVVVDPKFRRPAEVDVLLGDAIEGAPEARLGAEGAVSRAGADDGPGRPGPLSRARGTA